MPQPAPPARRVGTAAGAAARDRRGRRRRHSWTGGACAGVLRRARAAATRGERRRFRSLLAVDAVDAVAADALVALVAVLQIPSRVAHRSVMGEGVGPYVACAKHIFFKFRQSDCQRDDKDLGLTSKWNPHVYPAIDPELRKKLETEGKI